MTRVAELVFVHHVTIIRHITTSITEWFEMPQWVLRQHQFVLYVLSGGGASTGKWHLGEVISQGAVSELFMVFP